MSPSSNGVKIDVGPIKNAPPGLPKRSGALVRKHYRPKPGQRQNDEKLSDVTRITKMPDLQKVDNTSNFYGKI